MLYQFYMTGLTCLGDKEFDYALIVCILYHSKDSIRVLDEAMRISKRIIIIENT
ncbi:MAG: methionine biosynthesis protein MetW [Patescibacteria group bacterium]|nr:methionine biosynthesis protein MetW [Patescibacteria group bacterium]